MKIPAENRDLYYGELNKYSSDYPLGVAIIIYYSHDEPRVKRFDTKEGIAGELNKNNCLGWAFCPKFISSNYKLVTFFDYDTERTTSCERDNMQQCVSWAQLLLKNNCRGFFFINSTEETPLLHLALDTSELVFQSKFKTWLEEVFRETRDASLGID